jgi:hypothetical protein
MTLYVYPPSGTVLISPAAGTDFATETTLAAVETAVDGIETLLAKMPAGLVKVSFDYISANYAGATTDVWTYKTGGSGGTTVATVTITYVDSSKAQISTIGVA